MANKQNYLKKLGCVIALVLIFCVQLANAANVKDLRVWHAPERSRVVLELDKAPTYKRFFLTDPSRFVVDLQDFSLSKQAFKKLEGGQFISAIRVALRPNNVARVVLDLNQQSDVKVLYLKPVQGFRHRLVLDVYPKSPSKTTEQTSTDKGQTKQDTNASKSPDLKTAPTDKPFIIAIDAGHGGEDSGARGKRSYEKKIVMQIAKRLKKKIDARPGMQAMLTRKGDYFIPLRERTAIARKAGADLFISVHADAFTKRSARGSSVFALSLRGASSETARWLANKENAADLAGGVSISSQDDAMAKVLLSLSTNSTQHESITFASSVLKELKKIGKVHTGRVEKAGFAVLKSPDIPSILVETAFITNPAEEKLLLSAGHQEKLANAILVGAINYLESSHYHTASFKP